MYAIIDIETTGLSPKSEKITEIAVVVFDGFNILKQFHSLINPEKYIPPNIRRLTGITNEMVQDAPKFWEIAKELVLLTEGKTFVAHNVNFDYNFIRHEFKELGYNFTRDKLCTVKLSRKILPGKKSYSLGKICKEIGVSISDRHRALGDALATTELLRHLLSIQSSSTPSVNKSFANYSLIENLPEKTGVYYFHNHENEVIYIGKSKDIKNRVKGHFNNFNSTRSLRMLEQIYDITYEITGSELIALLKESHEIKEHQPVYNRAQRRKATGVFICHKKDRYGYINFYISNNSQGKNVVASFSSHKEAREYLFTVCKNNNLCQKLCGLYENAGACFDYHIKQCSGACIQKEKVEDYNSRAKEAIDLFHFKERNFFILDTGREEDERSVIKIEDGNYRGYGFISFNDLNGDYKLLHDIIETFQDNREIRRIINSYLSKNNVIQYIPY
jgi:DNA polymerase-3 subunit epsilon